ncbi:MAG: hypothetical protein A2X49_15470 [Lentisphaerae bacterium GWF2_52_8]|nr:MAG: hypothetical protein A2X49_15470 [Lentisphaerae bacterium GWF2_52_8]
MIDSSVMGGVWSAVPTPFKDDWKLDKKSIARLAEHQSKLGIKGLFIGGTSGEGPWLTQSMLRELARSTVKAAGGRMAVAVQVTDNSAARILDNISKISDSGADLAVIAPPFFQMKPSQDFLRRLYLEVLERSPMPIGLYHRGKHSSVAVSASTIAELAEHEKVLMIKDSSGDAEDKEVFLKLKRRLNNILLLNGNEFDCIPCLRDGYDGLLLGGACFNGGMALKIYDLTRAGRIKDAEEIQQRMNDLMYEVFGGKESCSCWLAGQKQMLVEMGIFSTNRTVINYALTPECGKAIKKVFQQFRDELFPY